VIDVDDIRARYRRAVKFLDERGRRLFAANEALASGYGGVTATGVATGLARSTIRRAIVELQGESNLLGPRVRRPGGGRKRAVALQPGLLAALEALIEDAIRGDPETPLRWVTRSQRQIARALLSRGFQVSQKLVGLLLRELGYSCQANRKTREGTDHPDRNAQFTHINTTVQTAIAAGEPAISVDTKKKELVGDFKNNGEEWQPEGCPEEVRSKDFPDKRLGKAIPYGIYDQTHNKGWVSVGIDHDTAEFATETIRRWWGEMGRPTYRAAKELLITADGGGSNGTRNRLWKVCLQRLADEAGLRVGVCHFPPGTSKWNKIEHRMFCHITQNWRGRPLTSREVVVNLIGNTRTRTGLEIHSELDEGEYQTAIKVTNAELAAVRLKRDAFHGEWNYTILPRK
jgi:hypothetical protein